MRENSLPSKSNHKETFIVEVQFKQNSTWQGQLTWTGEKKSLHFRSMLEMIQLMDEALSSGNDKQE